MSLTSSLRNVDIISNPATPILDRFDASRPVHLHAMKTADLRSALFSLLYTKKGKISIASLSMSATSGKGLCALFLNRLKLKKQRIPNFRPKKFVISGTTCIRIWYKISITWNNVSCIVERLPWITVHDLWNHTTGR